MSASSLQREPKYAIGTRIRRQFGKEGNYEGEITSFDGYHYRIHYTDGDCADMSEAEFDHSDVEFITVARSARRGPLKKRHSKMDPPETGSMPLKKRYRRRVFYNTDAEDTSSDRSSPTQEENARELKDPPSILSQKAGKTGTSLDPSGDEKPLGADCYQLEGTISPRRAGDDQKEGLEDLNNSDQQPMRMENPQEPSDDKVIVPKEAQGIAGIEQRSTVITPTASPENSRNTEGTDVFLRLMNSMGSSVDDGTKEAKANMSKQTTTRHSSRHTGVENRAPHVNEDSDKVEASRSSTSQKESIVNSHEVTPDPEPLQEQKEEPTSSTISRELTDHKLAVGPSEETQTANDVIVVPQKTAPRNGGRGSQVLEIAVNPDSAWGSFHNLGEAIGSERRQAQDTSESTAAQQPNLSPIVAQDVGEMTSLEQRPSRVPQGGGRKRLPTQPENGSSAGNQSSAESSTEDRNNEQSADEKPISKRSKKNKGVRLLRELTAHLPSPYEEERIDIRAGITAAEKVKQRQLQKEKEEALEEAKKRRALRLMRELADHNEQPIVARRSSKNDSASSSAKKPASTTESSSNHVKSPAKNNVPSNPTSNKSKSKESRKAANTKDKKSDKKPKAKLAKKLQRASRKPKYCVGTLFFKMFDGDRYGGIISSYDGKYYKVRYPKDGDEEELSDNDFDGSDIELV